MVVDVRASRERKNTEKSLLVTEQGMVFLPAIFGALIAALVIYPAVGGHLLLLDYVSGERASFWPAAAFGLSGAVNGGPLSIALFHILAFAPYQAGSWLPVFLFFPIAMAAMARLVKGPLIAGLAAGLLYTVNPFVFDRIFAGQIAFLLGYAVLPLALHALHTAANATRAVPLAVCWSGVTVALDEHFAWILVPLALAIGLTHSDRARATARLLAVGVGAAAASCYLLVPPLLVGTKPSGVAGQLRAYQTSGDPRVGLFVNAAGLYGFFRPGPEPKDLFSGWPAVLAALLIVIAVGYLALLRTSDQRRETIAVLAGGICGYFLALGGQGPTGGIFRLLYEHVPGFVIMREPEKFLALLALAYAYGFSRGVDQLVVRTKGVHARSRTGQLLPVAIAIVLPFAYTPNLVDGLGGHVQASEYPPSFSTASRIVGNGSVLFLPWHEYMATPYTQHRVVANTGPYLFRGRVIVGENPGPDYSFAAQDREHVVLDRLFSASVHPGNADELIGRLDVRFIALEKAADWPSYTWLGHQRGIRLVYSSKSIDLYSVRLTAGERADFARVHELSPVAYRVAAGRPGLVTLPVAYSPGWALDSRKGVELPDGELAVRVPASGGVVRFTPYPEVLACEIGSGAVFLLALAAAFYFRRRRGAAAQ